MHFAIVTPSLTKTKFLEILLKHLRCGRVEVIRNLNFTAEGKRMRKDKSVGAKITKILLKISLSFVKLADPAA